MRLPSPRRAIVATLGEMEPRRSNAPPLPRLREGWGFRSGDEKLRWITNQQRSMLSLDGTQYGNDALPRFPVSEQAVNHDHWTLSEAKCDASPDGQTHCDTKPPE